MPSPNLDKIKTIVIVMMENRSFDHALGYRVSFLLFCPSVGILLTQSPPQAKKGVQGEKAQRFSPCCKGSIEGKLTPRGGRLAARRQ
jgi:hypothetical protein